MRFAPLAILAAPLALAACGGAADDASDDASENLSVDEVVERTQAAAIKPMPGQYKVSMEVLEVNIPGAPANLAEMMGDSLGGQTQQYCLTEADVENGFEEMAKRGQDGDNCTFDRWNIDGGNFDGKMTCTVPGQGQMTMTMKGKGSETSSEVDMTMQGNMAGMGDATIRMKATHERIGDCG